jgi:hypothetical protein
MKTYRYGIKENAIGDEWYAIEKKGWFGIWYEVHRVSTVDKMMEIVTQLRDNGHLVFKA